LASAQAAVAEAEAALEDVQEGPQQGAVRQAELGVREAMIALEEARLAQSNAQVVAPIAGTVLTVDVDLGQQASAGQVVATLADTTDVKLTVNVEQRDIARVTVGQQVQIAIYALANDTFTGVVEQIAPIADAETGFVTFPVIIRFTDGPLDKVLPGMTASATFMPAEGEAPAAAPTVAPTEEAAEEATPEATEEATPEATEEASEETAAEPTAQATAEPTEEATPEATPEPTEEPAAEATATPSN
jgi:HlyD family secretion protein